MLFGRAPDALHSIAVSNIPREIEERLSIIGGTLHAPTGEWEREVLKEMEHEVVKENPVRVPVAHGARCPSGCCVIHANRSDSRRFNGFRLIFDSLADTFVRLLVDIA